MDVSEDNSYVPGTCNIGREEIKARKKLLVINLVVVIALTGLCFIYSDSLWIMTFLFITFSILTVMYIQIRQKFCVRYGITGYFNFGKPGNVEEVIDHSSKAKDKMHALKIILISTLFAVVFILIITFLLNLRY